MIRGPVWGGPQAAGKRHSQPFSQKRLPNHEFFLRKPRSVAPFLRTSFLPLTSERACVVLNKGRHSCAPLGACPAGTVEVYHCRL